MHDIPPVSLTSAIPPTITDQSNHSKRLDFTTWSAFATLKSSLPANSSAMTSEAHVVVTSSLTSLTSNGEAATASSHVVESRSSTHVVGSATVSATSKLSALLYTSSTADILVDTTTNRPVTPTTAKGLQTAASYSSAKIEPRTRSSVAITTPFDTIFASNSQTTASAVSTAVVQTQYVSTASSVAQSQSISPTTSVQPVTVSQPSNPSNENMTRTSEPEVSAASTAPLRGVQTATPELALSSSFPVRVIISRLAVSLFPTFMVLIFSFTCHRALICFVFAAVHGPSYLTVPLWPMLCVQ